MNILSKVYTLSNILNITLSPMSIYIILIVLVYVFRELPGISFFGWHSIIVYSIIVYSIIVYTFKLCPPSVDILHYYILPAALL